MRDLYVNTEEYIPPNSPDPQEHQVKTDIFVDSDHSGDIITRSLQAEIILYLDSA